MTIPVWEPGKLYAPGSIVQPRTALPNDPVVLQNPGFEAGDTSGWEFDITGAAVTPGATNYGPYVGAWNLGIQFGGARTDIVALNEEQPSCAPGTVITASVALKFSSAGSAGGQVIIRFYDIGGTQIGDDVEGPMYQKPGNASERWYVSSTSGIAPTGTASVRIGFKGFGLGNADMRIDALSWNYDSSAAVEGLVFLATQDEIGASAATEPNWPLTTGIPVVDNEVIWEGIIANRVAWKMRAILKSGPTEPTWPTATDNRAIDNTIAWQLETRRIQDPKAPQSKYIVIDQGKVYAADKDIIPFCATNNPLDWSKPNDAGYLNFGLGKYGANPIRVLGLYRGNLQPFNSQGFQLWQIDPDPQLNNRLDQQPVGSQFHAAYAPVGNDALFLTALGIRSIGVAAQSTSIKSGDVGMPVDPLVQPLIKAALESSLTPEARALPIAFFIPSAGQHWMCFNDAAGADTCEVFVYTIAQVGQVGAFSRYLFPHRIDAYSIEGDLLLLRAGDRILEYSEEHVADLMVLEDDEPTGGTEWQSTIWWPYLEMGGAMGQDKTVEAIDIVGTGGAPTIAFGWDQNDLAAFTEPFQVLIDTIPDSPIPFDLTAPSISVRLVYTGSGWQCSAVNVYLEGRRLSR